LAPPATYSLYCCLFSSPAEPAVAAPDNAPPAPARRASKAIAPISPLLTIADVPPAAKAGRIKLDPVNKGAAAPPVAAVAAIPASAGRNCLKLKASGRPVSGLIVIYLKMQDLQFLALSYE
jgi:hypothetical protein